jgi:hypothetical protein
MGFAARTIEEGTTVSAGREMPIFTKTFDFLAWLVPATNHFPRIYRQTVTQRLLEAALDFQEALLEANEVRGHMRMDWLTRADASLNKVRLYLRLEHRLRWLSDDQYRHVAQMVAELGRLLGAWQKATV